MSPEAQAIVIEGQALVAEAPTLETAKTFEEFESVRGGKPAGAKTEEAIPAAEKKAESGGAGDGQQSKTDGKSEIPKETQPEKKPEDARKPSGLERKFSKLTGKIRTLEDENVKLKAQLEASKPTEPVKSEIKAEEKPLADGRPRMPRLVDFMDKDDPQSALEDAMEKYNEDLSDWKIDQREKLRQREDDVRKTKDSEAKAATAWGEKIEEAKKSYPDYEEVALQSEDSEVEITSVMFGAMQKSPVGGHIGYFLMKNPAEAERIAALDPMSQALEIGARGYVISSEIDKGKPPAKNDNHKKLSEAPEPIKTVRAVTPARSLELDDNTVSFDEWSERRAALEKRR